MKAYMLEVQDTEGAETFSTIQEWLAENHKPPIIESVLVIAVFVGLAASSVCLWGIALVTDRFRPRR